MVCAHAPRRDAKPTVDRGVDSQINECVDCVYSLIKEQRYSECAAFLHYMHEKHIQKWVLIKRALLSDALTHRELSVVTDLLTASKNATLSEYAHKFPGLHDRHSVTTCHKLVD